MSGPTGTIVLKDCKAFLAQWDISADLYTLKISTTPDGLPDTTFGQVAYTKKPGLPTVKASYEGYMKYSTTATDAIAGRIESNIGVSDVPLSFSPDGGDFGETAVFFKAMFAKYTYGAKVGELLKFQLEAEASGTNVNLVRGSIIEDGKTSRTAVGNSATLPLGAISATQKLFAVLHVTEFVGTDVSFSIQSAVTDFATINARAAFQTVNGKTSEYLTPVAGPFTDTFWRLYWATVGGFTSFKAHVIVGIQ